MSNPQATHSASDSDYGFCRLCGKDIPPGGVRAIGVCVDCVAASHHASPVVIPQPTYRFNRGKDN